MATQAGATQVAVGLQLSEEKLIRAGQRGDKEAVELLFSRYQRPLFQTALRVLGNAEEAEDALQDAFLKAYAHLGEFRGDSRFSTWLVRIATNAALTKMRQRSSERRVSSTKSNQTDKKVSRPREMKDSYDNPEERYSKAELLGILSEVIESLNLSLRMVFVLRDFQSFSTEETARLLGLSEVAVRNRLLRARLQVRQRLHAWLRGEPGSGGQGKEGSKSRP